MLSENNLYHSNSVLTRDNKGNIVEVKRYSYENKTACYDVEVFKDGTLRYCKNTIPLETIDSKETKYFDFINEHILSDIRHETALKCPDCGSFNFTHNPSDDTEWICKNCGKHF